MAQPGRIITESPFKERDLKGDRCASVVGFTYNSQGSNIIKRIYDDDDDDIEVYENVTSQGVDGVEPCNTSATIKAAAETISS